MTTLPDTFALIREAQAGNQDACASLVTENAGLIWSIVHRYQRWDVDQEDLYQLGCLGFLKAVQGFDTGFGTQFSTYAVPKIAGEIRRFLRDDGMLRVSRSIKEQGLVIQRARERLSSELGRDPALSELSSATGLSAEDIAAADLATAGVTSLQAETGEDGQTLEELLGGDSPEESMVERVALRSAIDHLPQREQKLIFLRYYKGLTQDKTAAILGVSQVQVSRLEKKALQFLRWELSDF